MPDAMLQWGGDLAASPSGDLLLVSDAALSQQRVLRRLLTNPQDYIWWPSYGAGLGQFVGAANIERAAAGVIFAQIFNEASVAKQPLPVVAASTLPDGSVLVDISYTNVATGSTQALTFSMGL